MNIQSSTSTPETEEETEGQQTNHGNTRLPFGLCKKYHIGLPDNATPRDAWNALKQGVGITPGKVYDSLNKGNKNSGKDNSTNVNANQSANNNADSIDNVSDFSSLDNYLTKKYSVTVDNSVKDLDFNSVKEATKGIDFIFDEFPQAKSYFTKLKTTPSGIMSASLSGGIAFNPLYFKKDNATVGEVNRQQSASGYFPKNSNAASSGAHEAGHVLEAALIKKNSGGMPVQERMDWHKSTQAKAIVGRACKEVKKVTKKSYPRLKTEVSRYAIKGGDSECLAECVADYFVNRENASDLSKKVWEILKKELG